MADEEAGKKARKALPVKRHDWERVKAHFIEYSEPITLKDLSIAYSIPYQSVKERAAAERWTYLRAEYQSTVAQQAQKDRIKNLLRESEAFDEASLKAAKMGQNLIAGRLAQVATVFAAQQGMFNNAVQRLKNGQPVSREELYSAIRSSELLELANALDRFQNVGRRALGTDVQNISVTGEVDHHHEHELSVNDEIRRFDADRVAGFLEAAFRAGIPIQELAAGTDIEDAEIVGEEDDEDGADPEGQQQPQQTLEDVTDDDDGDDG